MRLLARTVDVQRQRALEGLVEGSDIRLSIMPQVGGGSSVAWTSLTVVSKDQLPQNIMLLQAKPETVNVSKGGLSC